jgi:hypothetical protein
MDWQSWLHYPLESHLWLAVDELSMEPEIKLLCSLETTPS